MKILFLYRFNEKRNFNHWINTDFIHVLNKIPKIEVKIYGYNITHFFSNLNLIPYNVKLTMHDLYKLFAFDIILIGNINRTFTSTKQTDSWLPNDFTTTVCPKILIEADYHKYRKSNWIKSNNINLILHRNKSNTIRGMKDFPNLKHIWFPFSVDTKIFKSKFSSRINKINFVGTIDSSKKIYPYRQEAAKILKEQNLLKGKSRLHEEAYIKCLQTYVSHLNGSSIYNIDCGKMFEIMASGSVLLTDNCNNGIKELFDDNTYITYKRDYSDLLNKAKSIIENPQLQKFITTNAIKCIKEKHTHYKRCIDLVQILKNNFNI